MTRARYTIVWLLVVLFSYQGYAQIRENIIQQPPELLNPYDKEVVQVNRPLLTWKAPLPILDNTVRYDLVLTELRAEQSAVQALQTNTPIISQRAISNTFLPYPVGVQVLEVGRTYVWQVTAFRAGSFLGQTDIWEFTYSAAQNLIMPPPVSYPFVKNRIKDADYQIGSTVYFAYENHFNETTLNYEVVAEDGTTITGLPTIPLTGGINKLEITLSLVDNAHYTLIIRDRSNLVYYLPFTYQSSPTP